MPWKMFSAHSITLMTAAKSAFASRREDSIVVTTPTVDELTELENAARSLEAAQAPDRAAHLHSLRDKIGTSLRDTDRRVLSRNVEDQSGPRPSPVRSARAQCLIRPFFQHCARPCWTNV